MTEEEKAEIEKFESMLSDVVKSINTLIDYTESANTDEHTKEFVIAYTGTAMFNLPYVQKAVERLTKS